MMHHLDPLATCTVPHPASERRRPRLLLGLAATVAWIAANPRPAFAEDMTTGASPVSAPTQSGKRRVIGIHLDKDPGWSVGLEGYAGLATLSTAERMKGHALAGGVSRLRISFFELGGNLEVSDLVDERWQSLGGFVGAFVPFLNWVDFDAAVGLSSRNWVSKDTRYGLAGASVRVPTLNFRLGVSDRISEGLLGPRMGAALLFGIDLKNQDVPWSYQIRNVEMVSGTTQFGGVTVAMVAGFGFDVAKRSR